jgi:hypothetical protein
MITKDKINLTEVQRAAIITTLNSVRGARYAQDTENPDSMLKIELFYMLKHLPFTTARYFSSPKGKEQFEALKNVSGEDGYTVKFIMDTFSMQHKIRYAQ